jgi:hypothetical protein
VNDLVADVLSGAGSGSPAGDNTISKKDSLPKDALRPRTLLVEQSISAGERSTIHGTSQKVTVLLGDRQYYFDLQVLDTKQSPLPLKATLGIGQYVIRASLSLNPVDSTFNTILHQEKIFIDEGLELSLEALSGELEAIKILPAIDISHESMRITNWK